MFRRSSYFRVDKKFDVCIIGGGPAGIAAAMRARDFGKKTCIVEQSRLGGKDVWYGTMHSKAMWEIAKFSAQCRGSSFRRFCSTQQLDDKRCSLLKPDFCVTRATILDMCQQREQQIVDQLKISQVQISKGKATFTSPYELCVYSDAGTFDTIHADYFVIATGSRPRRPPQFKPDGVHILSSEQILQVPNAASLLIIGGGAQGCEFAAIYSNMGTTKVTILERDERILPRSDDDIYNKVKALYEAKNVKLLENYELQKLFVRDNVVHFATKCLETGKVHHDTVEKALIALGRTPNYEYLGLDALERTVVQNGSLQFDKFGRCIPYRHVYVVGDAAGGKTVSAAETQGRSVVEHMFSFRPQSGRRFVDRYETQVMFLDQEVATIGWSETKCQQNAVSYRVASYSYEYVSRAMAMNNTKGFVKIIVTNDRQQNVLGVSAVGAQASSIVEIASGAVLHQRQVHELDALFSAYPAVSQAFQECARSLRGQSMIKPGTPGVSIRSWSPDKPRGRAFRGEEEQALPMATAVKVD